MLKVGVIGLGIGEQHAQLFDEHPHCEVTTLCDLDAAKLDEVSHRFPGRKTTRHAEAVLSDPEIDVVAIASYDDVHHPQVMEALRHGKHVFVEKPICLHRAEARDIWLELEQNPQLKLSSNLVLRLSSRFQELKRRIDAGELGELYCCEGDYNYGRVHKIVDGWRGRLDFYSVVLGGAVHMVDLLLWLSGDEVEEVTGFGTRIATRGTGFRFDDTAVCLLKMRSGMIAKVAANFGCVQPHFHGLNVYGTRATFLNRPEHAVFHTSSDPEAQPERIEAPYRDYRKPDLVWSFIQAILEGEEPLVSHEEVFRAMAVCFAIEESLEKGSPVRVVPFE